MNKHAEKSEGITVKNAIDLTYRVEKEIYVNCREAFHLENEIMLEKELGV